MRDVIEVPATGPDDPNGMRSAAILAAYFKVEHVQAFCGLLWRRLVALGVGWIVIATLIPGISHTAFWMGLGLIGIVAVGAVVSQRRAIRNLDHQVDALSTQGTDRNVRPTRFPRSLNGG